MHFELGKAPPEPSGAPLAHSGSQRYIFRAIWEPRGGLGAPLGHSLGSLLQFLRALWQHMFAMLPCRVTQGGNWRPKVVKVLPAHAHYVVKT